MSRVLDVPCTVHVARTPEALFAHVALDGVDVAPGDTVLVHDAPAAVDEGASLLCERRATVVRARWFTRLWTQLLGCIPVADLFEVGFSAARPGPHPSGRKT